ncbi:MAG: hypothetical protein DRQ51_04935 [Gammaproteobacteria bacterium]|nr:MAG: hypothetical protein DRQ51_04935 [Gammaproteobacteria bacterium]
MIEQILKQIEKYDLDSIFSNNRKSLLEHSELFLKNILRYRRLLSNNECYNPVNLIEVEQNVFYGEKNVFGIYSKNHSFNFPDMRLGFELKEADITKTLCFHINESQLIGKSFVEALLGEKPNQVIVAEAEKKTKNKRIDIVVEWVNNKNKKRNIVIEAKFNHILKKEQLSSYRNWAKEKKKEEGVSYDLVYLTKTGEKPDKKFQTKEPWLCLSWETLLRNWENILSQNSGEIFKGSKLKINNISYEEFCFHSFRKEIWKKI